MYEYTATKACFVATAFSGRRIPSIVAANTCLPIQLERRLDFSTLSCLWSRICRQQRIKEKNLPLHDHKQLMELDFRVAVPSDVDKILEISNEAFKVCHCR